MSLTDRITELEKRLAAAEARIADLETFRSGTSRQLPVPIPGAWPPVPTHGCICPPGAEFGCNSAGCPRRGLGPVPVTWGGGT
ncbi:MAG: hypothetical protein RLZZ129_752 [Verrucomicrobiota bacterium]|jgi:hypothetical protein